MKPDAVKTIHGYSVPVYELYTAEPKTNPVPIPPLGYPNNMQASTEPNMSSNWPCVFVLRHVHLPTHPTYFLHVFDYSIG